MVDDALLSQVAEVLKVPAEAIKNFDEEAAIYNIQNNYEGSNTGATGIGNQIQNCTFNPLEKYIEAVEENKKLYERLLRAEREKNDLLQSMLKK